MRQVQAIYHLEGKGYETAQLCHIPVRAVLAYYGQHSSDTTCHIPVLIEQNRSLYASVQDVQITRIATI
jgi:hypothetical protein